MCFPVWFLLLTFTAIDTKKIENLERDPKLFNLEELRPSKFWTPASIPDRTYYNYDYSPYHFYHKPSVSISNLFRKILGWKTKPLYKPYYKPYVGTRPPKRTTTTTTTSAPVLPCECGVSNPARKIIGGDETGVNQYPWMVALCSASPCNKVTQFCGGFLINDMYVLTAAHCIDTNIGNPGGVVFVSLGDHDLTSDDETTSIEVEVEEQIFFPGYTPDEFLNDMALLKLPNRITITDNIRPICLPKNDGNTNAGDLAIVSGWGNIEFQGASSDVLLDVSVPVFNNDACSKQELHPIFGDIPETQLCAGGMGENSCNGDSGGPLITEVEDNKFEQIGMVSYGSMCETPGVYTRISKFLDWIKENTEGALYCASK